MHENTQPFTQCMATAKSGERCKKPPVYGTAVCRTHGGALPQVKAAARRRILEAAGKAAERIEYLLESAESEKVQLDAAKDILDRAGITRGKEITISETREILQDKIAEILQDTDQDDE